jgi:Cytochrome c7 and related cytochrome c
MIRCKLVETFRPDDTQIGARVGRAVSGDTLTLGRAAACKIYLPDPRVRLEHACIRRAEDGWLYLDATGPVVIDQQPRSTARLVEGQTISIGPYDFVVEAVEDGLERPDPRLTLSFELRAAAQAPAQAAPGSTAVGVHSGWFGRRALAWMLSLAMLALAGWPVWHAYQPPAPQPATAMARPSPAGAPAATPAVLPAALPGGPTGLQAQTLRWVGSHGKGLDRWWNPGTVSSAHQSFGQDCRSCHDKPFERVTDASCTACHAGTGEHIRDVTVAQHTFQGQRCATCHKEHQGTMGMRSADTVGCVQCHGNVRAYSPLTTLDNVSDFARDHPPFRLSMRQRTQGHPVQRVTQTAALRNDTGLVFPHDVHLDKRGIKSPTGPASTGGRVVLACADCHVPDAPGTGFEPVSMARNCQSCHRLSVDPQAPEREVPHAKPETVAVAVREIYASLALDRVPVSLVTVNSLLQRPAGEAASGQVTPAARWVRQQSQATFNQMFAARNGVCRTCHEVQAHKPAGGQGAVWSVAPIVVTDRWLPQTLFSHAQHKQASCVSCHEAPASRLASDILIPDIASCRTCHAGATKDQEKVVSRCDSCHGFHPSKEHPAFQASAKAAGVRP